MNKLTKLEEMEEHVRELRSTIDFLTTEIRSSVNLLEQNENTWAKIKLQNSLDDNRFRYR